MAAAMQCVGKLLPCGSMIWMTGTAVMSWKHWRLCWASMKHVVATKVEAQRSCRRDVVPLVHNNRRTAVGNE